MFRSVTASPIVMTTLSSTSSVRHLVRKTPSCPSSSSSSSSSSASSSLILHPISHCFTRSFLSSSSNSSADSTDASPPPPSLPADFTQFPKFNKKKYEQRLRKLAASSSSSSAHEDMLHQMFGSQHPFAPQMSKVSSAAASSSSSSSASAASSSSSKKEEANARLLSSQQFQSKSNLVLRSLRTNNWPFHLTTSLTYRYSRFWSWKRPRTWMQWFWDFVLFANLQTANHRAPITVSDIKEGIPTLCQSIFDALNLLHLPESREYLKSVTSHGVYEDLINWHNLITDSTSELNLKVPKTVTLDEGVEINVIDLDAKAKPVEEEYIVQVVCTRASNPQLSFPLVLYHLRDGDAISNEVPNQLTTYAKELLGSRNKMFKEKAEAQEALAKKRERDLEKFDLPPELKKMLKTTLHGMMQSPRTKSKERIQEPFYEVERPENYVSSMDLELVFSVETHVHLWKKSDLLEWHQQRLKKTTEGTSTEEDAEDVPVPEVTMFRREPFTWRLRAYLPPPQPHLNSYDSAPVWSTAAAPPGAEVPEVNFVVTKI